MNTETAQIDLQHLQSLIGPKTKLIAVGGASNAVGTITDLRPVREMARGSGALLFVDAVHLAPHQLIDVRAIGCDFMACSAYKFYGPHIGLLYMRAPFVDDLPFPKLDPAPDSGPERAETGTQNQEGIAGCTAAIDFLASIGGTHGSRRERLGRAFAGLHEQGMRQTRQLWDALAAMPRVRLYGPRPGLPRTPTVGFTVEGVTSTDVARALAAKALFASHGDFYAATVIERLGLGEEGLVRVGCACYTSDEEIARLTGELERISHAQVSHGTRMGK
jgi:selenocysteine lyase/cysteine desulfurase